MPHTYGGLGRKSIGTPISSVGLDDILFDLIYPRPEVNRKSVYNRAYVRCCRWALVCGHVIIMGEGSLWRRTASMDPNPVVMILTRFR